MDAADERSGADRRPLTAGRVGGDGLLTYVEDATAEYVAACVPCCCSVQVEVLWLVNMQSRQWESQLPNDTQAFLNSSRDDKDRWGAAEEAACSYLSGIVSCRANRCGASPHLDKHTPVHTQTSTSHPASLRPTLPLPIAPTPPSDLRHYPYISTFTANYSPELVTLLSQQASWSLLQAAAELRELLAAAAAPNATAAGNAAVGGGAAANETASAAGVGAAGLSAISNRTIGGGGDGDDNGTVQAEGAGGAAAFGVGGGANGTAESVAAAAMLLAQLASEPFPQQIAGALPPRVVAQLETRNASKGLPEPARQPVVSYVMALEQPPPQQQPQQQQGVGTSTAAASGGGAGSSNRSVPNHGTANSTGSSSAAIGGSSTGNSTTAAKIVGPEVQGAQAVVATAPPPGAAAQGAAVRAGDGGSFRRLCVLLAACAVFLGALE